MSFDFSPRSIRQSDPALAIELETANLILELETITDYAWAVLGTELNPLIAIELGPTRSLVLAPSSRTGATSPTWGPFQMNLETGEMVQLLQVNASIQEATHISMMFSVEAFSVRAVITKVILAISK
jgi:hypothetical protein